MPASLARSLGLRGLNSADFLIEGDNAWLIEINPRPGATLDLFDSPSAAALRLACRCLPRRAAGARAAMARQRRGRDRLRHAPDPRDACARLARNGAPTGKAPGRAWKPARRSAPFGRKRVPQAAPGPWSKRASLTVLAMAQGSAKVSPQPVRQRELARERARRPPHRRCRAAWARNRAKAPRARP